VSLSRSGAAWRWRLQLFADLAGKIPVCVYWIAYIATIGLHFVCEQQWVYKEAKKNRDLGIEINNEIEAMIGRSADEPNKYNPVAHYWQVVVTALLGLVVYATMYLASAQT